MEEVSNRKMSTVQGRDTPVLALRGEQAGPGASLSDDLSTMVVADLVTMVSTATCSDNVEALAPDDIWGKLKEVDAVECAQLTRMRQVLDSMKVATEKQRNVSNAIKEGIPRLGELVDIMTFSRVTRCKAIRALQLAPMSPATPPRTPAAICPPQKRGRAALSSPEDQEEEKRRKTVVQHAETWTTVTKKRAEKKNSSDSLSAPQKGKNANTPPNIKKGGNKNKEPAKNPYENKKPDGTQAKKKKKKKKKKKRKPRQRSNWSAVVVKPAEGKTYAEVLGAIRQKVRPEDTEMVIRTARKTKEGAVLLELDRCGNQIALQRAIQEAVGQSGEARTLTSRVRLEVLDMDCLTTSAEVEDAVRRELGDDMCGQFKVAVFAPNARELRMAARKLLEKGKLCVGWIRCRLRQRTDVQRCFRCLGFGHRKQECKRPDRSGLCWKCDQQGHKATACTTKPCCFLCSDGAGGQGEGSERTFFVLQGNLNRSRVVDDLLTQFVHERRASVAIVSVPYRTRANWHVDSSGSAAIWVIDPLVRIANRGAGCCYAWVTTEQATFVSCYLSPNDNSQRFRDKLEALEDDLRDIPGALVVAGDFNARAIEWDMPQPNTRGKLVLEMAVRLGLVVLNVGATPTYRQPGFGYSIPDITLVSEDLVRKAVGWRVMEDFTGSDHQYITFQLIDATRKQPAVSARRPSGWNAAKMDGEKFVATLLDGARHIPPVPEDANDVGAVDALVDTTMGIIHRACDASMPRKRPWKGRTQAYWWNDQIAELRRRCHQLRRLAQRAAGRPEAAEKALAYKAAKKALGKAIRTSKECSWKQLCDEVDQDPWGRGYKLVMGKLRPPTQVMDERKARYVVDALFPTHPVTVEPRLTDEEKDIPPFRAEELVLAERSMKSGKAPGPDDIPAEAIKAAARNCPGLLLGMYNGCLRAVVFPARWKLARLALIPKGKGDSDSPSFYRPLCVLDTAGKMMERLLKTRNTVKTRTLKVKTRKLN
ncbi:uncharacterized protein LOC114881259 [Osmia bicornis bicornis]|uniref:uncharacterized protein LOC114881259 n=1 Tax=Osmia bicornis bicornis TaxID=1437191 RepID=UPI001EAE8C93|nr:uncharacterized protein LOC114881259 [Osmia bicornis bicornis]